MTNNSQPPNMVSIYPDDAIVSSQYLTINSDAQIIAVTDTSAPSNVVAETTSRVVLIPSVDCWVAIGAGTVIATASAPCFRLPANVPFYPIKVTGGVTKIAAIRAGSTSGTLSIVESE
jgi:hypothetical protein